MVLKIFVATKNAHVFASSSFVGLGVLIFSKNRKKERRHHHSDDDDEEREREKRERERGKEEEEEEEDVLRLFVFFFSEFLRGVVFVSRVESQHGRHGERQRWRRVCPSRGRAAPFSRGETIQQTARESHLPALSTDRRLLHRVWRDDETTTKDDQNGKSKRRKTWILSVMTT